MTKIIHSLFTLMTFSLITSTYADFDLSKIKDIAEKIKTIQGKPGQETQTGSHDVKVIPTNTPFTESQNLPSNNNNNDFRSTIAIAGIKLGMTRDEAIQALKNHNPGLKWRGHKVKLGYGTFKFQSLVSSEFDGIIVASSGPVETTSGKAAEVVQVDFSAPWAGSKVIGVYLIQQYANQNELALSEVVGALKSKFGEPSRIKTEALMNGLFWDYKIGGSAKQNSPQECPFTGLQLGVQRFSLDDKFWSQNGRRSVTTGTQRIKGCGPTAVATIYTGGASQQANKNLVWAIVIGMKDNEAIWNEVDMATNKSIELNKKAATQAEEAAESRGKPNF